MAVSGVNNNTDQQSVSNAVKNVLGKDDFLKLLVTQLKYQDPMEPTDNQDFLAQMAQFSSLEQMNNMSEGFTNFATLTESMLRETTIAQAVNMIGKTVTAVSPSGTVSGTTLAETGLHVSASSDSMVLKTIPADTEVTLVEKEDTMYKVKLSDGTTGYIDANDIEVGEADKITGVVTGMVLVDGIPNVTINGENIPISYIEEVKQAPSQGGDSNG